MAFRAMDETGRCFTLQSEHEKKRCDPYGNQFTGKTCFMRVGTKMPKFLSCSSIAALIALSGCGGYQPYSNSLTIFVENGDVNSLLTEIERHPYLGDYVTDVVRWGELGSTPDAVIVYFGLEDGTHIGTLDNHAATYRFKWLYLCEVFDSRSEEEAFRDSVFNSIESSFEGFRSSEEVNFECDYPG